MNIKMPITGNPNSPKVRKVIAHGTNKIISTSKRSLGEKAKEPFVMKGMDIQNVVASNQQEENKDDKHSNELKKLEKIIFKKIN